MGLSAPTVPGMPNGLAVPRSTAVIRGEGRGNANGKGKEIASINTTGGYDQNYPYGTMAPFGSLPAGLYGQLSPHTGNGQARPMATAKAVIRTNDSTLDSRDNSPRHASFSIPPPLGDLPGGAVPTSDAIASALYDAVQGQLSSSPLSSALLEQLPAAAGKAIDASMAHMQQAALQQQSSTMAMQKAPGTSSGIDNGQFVAPSQQVKWKDAPLSKQVSFALFVTDCLRASPTILTANSTTTTSSSGATITTTSSSMPVSPAPELDRLFPVALTTYHPLVIEAHFSILIALLMLGEPQALLETFVKSAISLDGADGYPVFSPARSMAQADFNEILERLCSSWKHGKPARNQNSADSKAKTNSSAGTSQTQAGSSDGGGPMPEAESSSSGPKGRRGTFPTSQGTPEQPYSPSTFSGLAAIRTLLAPVYAKLQQRRKTGKTKGSGIPMMLLCSPRVDIVLAWLAAVHLPNWEDAANLSSS